MKYLNVFLVLLCFSCSKKEGNNNSSEPANLTVSVDVSTDGSGKVAVTANADNAVQYHFFMGDDNPAEPYQKIEGFYEHIYTTLGTYQIEVRAYGLDNRYIRKTLQVAVDSGEPVSVGQGYTTPTSYDGMTLVWNDEFEGASLNSSNWSYDLGDGCPNLCGWGNAELEYYRQENCSVSGGVLTLEARKENFGNRNYTSGKIVSRGKQSFKYGRIDVRATLPKGQGMWPALWLLGINQQSVGWPKCGEIDMMEMVGGNGRENTSLGNVFWDNNGQVDFKGDYTLPSGIFADEFHVFSIIWDESKIEWFVDDQKFHTFSTLTADRTEFHKEFYLIMNLAVGGTLPGSPDNTTIFPQQMQVDYIRVFQM